MYIPSFVKPEGVKFKASIPTKIFIIENDRNHSNFHSVMVEFGPRLRLP